MAIDKRIKYLNDKAPKGEFLAYINKKEAAMLKKAGGSGKKVNGIPSFRPQDMGNKSNQKASAANTGIGGSRKGPDKGTGGSSGNIGGGGGGQDSDNRRYQAPTKKTYTSKTIDSKPVTGDDFRRSQNEFVNNLNINNASRFEPSFFNRTYQPVTLDQIGSRNQLPDYGSSLVGGILSLMNPLAGKLYSGYNYLKNKVPKTFNTFKNSPTLVDFYQNMKRVPVNNTIDIREKFDRSGILSEVKPVQTFEFDPSSFNTRNVETVNSFDDIEGQVTELTDKQKAFIKNKQFALQENLINADDVFNTINNPDLGVYDKGIMGFGEQEPTTLEEYNNYLQSLGINQRAV